MQKLSLIFVSMTFIGCHRSSLKEHSEFIEPLPSPVLTLDPAGAQDTDSMQVVREVFEPLFKITPKGQVEPHLVKGFTVSKDQRIFILKLKPKILFHDGKELTSEDLKWTINRNINHPCYSYKAKNIFNGLLEIVVLSKYSVKLVFNQPKPYLISQLTTLNSAPMAKDSVLLGKPIIKPDQMVGTGPYRISYYQPHSEIHFQAFNFYHDQKPKIQIIKRPLVTDPQVRLNLFIKKKADKIILPRMMLNTIENNKDLFQCCKVIPRLSTTYLAVGLKSHPYLQDKSFRKALLGWISLESLQKEITLKTAILAKNFVPYKIPDYHYSKSLPIHHTKELERLLSEKGYSLQNPLILKIYYRSDNPNHQRVAEILAREWNKCRGLEIKLVPSQRHKIHLAKETQEMHLFITRWLADYPLPNTGLECFIKNNPQNYCGLSDDTYDSLIDIATKNLYKDNPYRKFEKAEKYILDQAIILPLTHDSEIELIQNNIKGFKTNFLFDLSYKTLSFDRGSKTQ